MQIVELSDRRRREVNMCFNLGQLVYRTITLSLEQSQLLVDESPRFSVGELCVEVGEP